MLWLGRKNLKLRPFKKKIIKKKKWYNKFMIKKDFKILFVGDVYGRPGRRALKEILPNFIDENNIDFVIVNAENASHGKSLSKEHYLELKELNIDCFTMGNHTFYANKLLEYIDEVDDILIPANFNAYSNYEGSKVFKKDNKKIRVTSLLGQTFMFPIGDNPWKKLESIIKKDESDIHIVDFHAEATSEKIALAMSFDGKITAQVGTHTHVQTADEKILPKNTGFISDVGMTGPYYSIIGSKPEPVIKRLKTGMPEKFHPAKGRFQFMACIIIVDYQTNLLKEMKRISIIEDES